MELVTHSDESQKLQEQMGPRPTMFDVVLDDGSYLTDTAVVDDRAVGIVVGGHTGFIAFADVPSLASRRVHHALRLSGIYYLPFLGHRLRRRWAARAGVRLVRPSWVPRL